VIFEADGVTVTVGVVLTTVTTGELPLALA
jgi:hypothetical protein